MIKDIKNYFTYHTSWNTRNNSAEIGRINLLLAKYGLRVNDCVSSPTVTTYFVDLEVDSKINTLLKLEKNFAIAVNDNNCRVYQDGARLCIEKKGADNTILIGDVLTPDFESDSLKIMLGKDNYSNNVYYDLEKAPHLLIAGTTGSGKSMLIHSIMLSLLINHPSDVDFIAIDPKGTELKLYGYLSACTFVNNTVAAIQTLKKLVDEMELRYTTLSQANCRDIDAYVKAGHTMRRKVCVIDEFADLMLTGGSQVEEYVVRLAQKARAAGIHLVIATQRPSADVITGLIKANIPTRIALTTRSAIESRIIIDQKGAEMLNGKGDMLFLANGKIKPIRVQGCLVEEKEINSVCVLAYATNDSEFAKTHNINV